jgi:hypothetical protein
MRFSIPVAVSLLAVLVLSACGQSGPTQPSASRSRLSGGTSGASPAPLGQPVAPQTALDPAVQQMITRAIARLDAIKTIEGKVRFEEWKDSKHETGLAKITFRAKPFAARVDVEQSSRVFGPGTSVLWSGGTELKVKPIRMPFSLKFGYDNSQVVSLRGYRMDQTDLFSMGKVLKHPNAQIKAIGPKAITGDQVFLLEVHSPGSTDDVDREIIGLSLKHQIPTYREMYAGQKMVHRGQGLNLKFDQSISSDKFKM